jgi:hypothetical protein
MSSHTIIMLACLALFAVVLIRWAWWLHPRCPQCRSLMNRSRLDSARAICPRCHMITRLP